MKKTYCIPFIRSRVLTEELPLAGSNEVYSKGDDVVSIDMNKGTMGVDDGSDAAVKINPVDWNE